MYQHDQEINPSSSRWKLKYDQKDSREIYENKSKRIYKKIKRSDHNQHESDQEYSSSNESGSSYSEEYYEKRRNIYKKKDSINDNPDEIKKWIAARKKNYPSRNREKSVIEKKEMSVLETKIRKKILLINSNPRNMLKKLRNLDILKRFLLNPNPKKQYKPKKERFFEPQKEKRGEEIMEENEAKEEPINKEIVHERVLFHNELTAQSIIDHLIQKQKEDTEWVSHLMDYKSNTANYHYHCQTLEASLVLEDVFSEASFLLQTIRYIVNNNFFED